MRAVVVKTFGGPEALEVIDTPIPEPGPGEVRVKVGAAGVNFADVMVRAGMLINVGATSERAQYGVGVDFAGQVDALGAGVTRFAEGDVVMGTQERLDGVLGPYAEYVVIEDWALAHAPSGVSVVEAASLPLPAITAEQALVALDLRAGQWLLVTGAAGGVGGFAIELAVLRGLRVIAQARPEDEALVRGLGAEAFVSRYEHLADAVRALVPGGADGALDAANLGVLTDDAVRHGGAYVNLLNSAPASRRGVRTYNVAWQSNPDQLAKLSALAGDGRLTLRVAQTFALQDAVKAHQALDQGGQRGRLILVP